MGKIYGGCVEMEMKWIKVAYVQPGDYRKVIDMQKSCDWIDKFIKLAYLRSGTIFVCPINPNEPLTRGNIRKPTVGEWQEFVLYARNKCRQIDRTYFLRDPDPTSTINGYEEEQSIYTTGINKNQ